MSSAKISLAGAFGRHAKADKWLDHSTYQSQRYLPALDGIRAIAIALVITRHLHERMWDFFSGSVGVTIFFVLSGYLITRLTLQEEQTFSQLNVAGFYLRRTFRIFPLYYLVLGVYALLILGAKAFPNKIIPFRTALPYYLTYLQELPYWNLVGSSSRDLPFYQSWSLGIEEKFYLIFPLLLITVSRLPAAKRLVIVIVASLICIVQGIASEGRPVYHLESYAFILFGVLFALLLSNSDLYSQIAPVLRKLALPALLFAAATQFVLMPYTSLRGLSTLYAITIAILIGYVVISTGWPVQVLSHPILVLVGRVSYGIYLVHILCVSVIERVAKPGRGALIGILAYAGTLLLSTGAAYLLYVYFERPITNLGRRLSRRLTLQRATN